jgi:hypothetical protein
MPILAMIDPAAGIWGTLIFASTCGVGPIALVAHIFSRRYFLVNFASAGVFTILVFGFWLYMSVTSSHSPGFRYVWTGFLFSLGASFVAGLPIELYRCWRRSRGKPV